MSHQSKHFPCETLPELYEREVALLMGINQQRQEDFGST